MPVFAFTAGSFGDILATAGLAAELAQVLYDNRSVAKECESLAQDLKSIQSALILTEYALQKYGATPLGEVLVHYVRPEVAQCHLSLYQFSEQLKACQKALSVTSISNFWRRIVWVASDEAASLSTKLSNLRLKLSLLLISLNSVGFMDPGHPHFLEAQGPRPLRRIKDNTINVLDPLGDTIPVSTLFCGSWESFHYIINGYFKNRMGQQYIERGDYEIVRPDTEEVLDHSAFVRDIKEGEIVEMSVVLRPEVHEQEARCPRCSRINTAPFNDSWIRCAYCSGQYKFQHVTHREVNDIDEQHESDVEDIDNTLSSTSSSTSHSPNHVASTLHNDVRETTFFRRITLELHPLVQINDAAKRELEKKEFVDTQHPNYIDGVWHCSNCGCPESIAIGRRKGPLGDKSQCGTCGKFWHRHRRLRPVEYNSDPDFHSGLRSPQKTLPPQWLSSGLAAIQPRYPNDMFEVILRKVNARSTPEWRIKCLDCPGKLYIPGPGESLSNYDVHLKNRQHRHHVNERLAAAAAHAAGEGGDGAGNS